MRSSTATRNADALAERQERIKALTEKLEIGVKAVFASEDYARYLEAMSKFHHYSFGNCLLIYFQCPEAQAVASRAWNTVRLRRAIMTPRMMMNRYMHSTTSPNTRPNSCRMTEKIKSL